VVFAYIEKPFPHRPRLEGLLHRWPGLPRIAEDSVNTDLFMELCVNAHLGAIGTLPTTEQVRASRSENRRRTMTLRSLQLFVERLGAHTCLTEEERLVLLSLPTSIYQVSTEQALVQPNEPVQSSCIVLRGILAGTSNIQDGERQITSFYVPGDMPDLHTLLRPKANFGLRAICSSDIARVPHAALLEAMRRFAGISEAFARELVREGDVRSEWVVNLGKRTAKQRIAHLFCEMAVRTKMDKETHTEFPFPVTQAVLADATGLSTVHVNRSIQALRHEGLLSFVRGTAQIPDWKALAKAADFDRGYLEVSAPMRRLTLAPSEGLRTAS
jgi:CRP-like cAMP-binding protein